MAPHSSTLAWKIPWMEEPGGLQSMGSRRVRHDWATSLSLFTFMHWRRKWQPTPVFLPGEFQGRGSLVGCRLWGRKVGHEWSDLVAAAAATVRIRGEFIRPQSPFQMCFWFTSPSRPHFMTGKLLTPVSTHVTHRKGIGVRSCSVPHSHLQFVL